MQSSFEDFVRIGEANVFSGLFGSLSSDSEDDAAKEVEDTLQEHGELKIGAQKVADPKIQYEYTSTNGITVHLVEKKERGIAHQVWPAAEYFCEFLVKHPSIIITYAGERCNIIELGAGLGLVGIFASLLLPSQSLGKIILTDLPEAMEGLAENIHINSANTHGAIEAGVLQWGDDSDADLIWRKCDATYGTLVVAADCIYWECLFEPLCRTLRMLVSRGCHILLSHVKRWKKDAKFFAMCKKLRMAVDLLEERIVHEPAVHTGRAEKKITRMYHIYDPAL
jgi:hypothetical protein